MRFKLRLSPALASEFLPRNRCNWEEYQADQAKRRGNAKRSPARLA